VILTAKPRSEEHIDTRESHEEIQKKHELQKKQTLEWAMKGKFRRKENRRARSATSRIGKLSETFMHECRWAERERKSKRTSTD